MDKRGWRVRHTLPEGFELWEQDDHCVDLYHGKEHVAVFSAAAVTERVVLEACREYLEECAKPAAHKTPDGHTVCAECWGWLMEDARKGGEPT